MQKKNFVGFRDRVLLHLLQFAKQVYDNIHGDQIDGDERDFLAHLTQEGIAEGVGTKQSTIYKELQTLRSPAVEGEEPLINAIEKARVPGKKRACTIYYLTQYGKDLAHQKMTYLEAKKLEVQDYEGKEVQVVSIEELIILLIDKIPDLNPVTALLKIAANATPDGIVSWNEVLAPPELPSEAMPKEILKPAALEPPPQALLNPYFNRIAIKDPKYFFGREEEVHYIMSLLRNTQSCSIVGPRRIGKSSLINYISHPEVIKKYGLGPDEFIFVSIDLEGLGELTQSDFFQIMVEELRNRITDDELRRRMETVLEKETIRFLDLKNIIKNISDSGKKIIFLLDEFELITNNENLDCNFFSGLRNLANSYNVGYITASHTPLLDLTFSKETLGSPFFNFFSQIDLSLVKKDEVQDIIITPSRSTNVVFPENIINLIENTTGPHPFFLQMLCFHAFEWLRDKGSISDSDLPIILERFENEALPHFHYFWTHLTPEEQEVIKKLQIKKQLSDQPSLHTTIKTLKRKALLVEAPEGIRLFSDAFEEYISKTDNITMEGILESKPKLAEDESLEVEPDSQRDLVIELGNCYFVDEDAPNMSVTTFQDLTKRGLVGLFISRTPVEKAKGQWQLENSNVIWLCSKTGENCLPPSLQKIFHLIFEFIKQNTHSVIFFDGLEYIINKNDFERTLTLIENIKENIALHNSVFIVPISATVFSEREMALLCKNSVKLPKGAALDFSKVKIK